VNKKGHGHRTIAGTVPIARHCCPSLSIQQRWKKTLKTRFYCRMTKIGDSIILIIVSFQMQIQNWSTVSVCAAGGPANGLDPTHLSHWLFSEIMLRERASDLNC